MEAGKSQVYMQASVICHVHRHPGGLKEERKAVRLVTDPHSDSELRLYKARLNTPLSRKLADELARVYMLILTTYHQMNSSYRVGVI
jgi:hypothetical protein